MKQMKKMARGFLCGALAVSLLGGATCFAAEAQTAEPAAVAASQDSVNTINFYAGSINFNSQPGYMNVYVTTEAFTNANKIWHDITIYRNGVWVMSQTYTDWNTYFLETSIDVPAQNGDRIEVYVDHHVDSETRHNERSTIKY